MDYPNSLTLRHILAFYTSSAINFGSYQANVPPFAVLPYLATKARSAMTGME
jgi:hypothetical protein